MSEIVIAGNTSGSVTIAAPDVAGTTTLTLPATSGALVTDNGSGTIEATAFVGDGSGLTNLPSSGGVTSLNGQSGDITNTNSLSIGSYVNGRPANATSYARNATVAGSSLTVVSTGTEWNGSTFVKVSSGTGVTSEGTAASGTWRCMSGARSSTFGSALCGIWVRIS